MFNIIKFLDDYNINYSRSGENVGKDWIGVNCPFCNDNLKHGGFNSKTGGYKCWRCGYHKISEIAALLSGVSLTNIKRVLNKYYGESRVRIKEKDIQRPSKVQLPDGCGAMRDMHKNYLIKRNFNPRKLAMQWGLLGTGQTGDYAYRIIAPIYLNGKLVSYQGRDVTGKQKQKYKACAKKNEVYHHKDTLYGIDYAKNQSVIVVEGITDVWRMGYGSVSTFGIDIKIKQIMMLTKKFKSIFILFDKEDNAQEKAWLLYDKIIYFKTKVEVNVLDYADDPAELTDEEAQKLKSELI